MLLHGGHITAYYSRHDSDIHVSLGRLDLESDHVTTVRIIHKAQRICGCFASFPILAEKHLHMCTVSTVNLEKSDLNQFSFFKTNCGTRRLLHPVQLTKHNTNDVDARNLDDRVAHMH